MASELFANGPVWVRPPLLFLLDAIAHIGPRVCPDWNGTERIAAIRADEGQPMRAPEREPPPAPEPRKRCSKCDEPATLIRADEPYCDAHAPDPLPIPEALRRHFPTAQFRDASAATPPVEANEQEEPAEPEPEDLAPPIDQLALYRWVKVHAALRGKVLDGEVPADLAWPPSGRATSGKLERLTAEQWRNDGFPSPYEARAHHASRGLMPMNVIFDIADLNRAFPPRAPAADAVRIDTTPREPASEELDVGAASIDAPSPAPAASGEAMPPRAPMTKKDVENKLIAEIETVKKQSNIFPNDRAMARQLAEFAENLEGNTAKHYTISESLRTGQKWINCYRRAPSVEQKK